MKIINYHANKEKSSNKCVLIYLCRYWCTVLKGVRFQLHSQSVMWQ